MLVDLFSYLSEHYVVGLILVGVLVIIAWRIRAYRRRLLTQYKVEDERRCVHCGYSLIHLQVPRCPECGRAVGFDKTFDELGIDEAEVIRYTESQRVKDGDEKDGGTAGEER